MTTAPRIPSVGFIGLGVMGEPMAGHLAKAGYRIALFAAAHSPAEVARVSDIVVTMVPNGEVVRDLVGGEHGLLQGFAPGALLLDTSSSEPWLTEETGALLGARGVAMVDAPVSGAEWGAKAAELVFMVGGAPADLERVRPLLAAMGKAVFHVGGLGAGHAMKCLNNLITSVNLLALSEGLAMGKRYGLDPEAMVDVLNVSTGMSWVAQTHIKQRVISRRFDDPFKLALMVKDIGIAMALARATGTPAPLSESAQRLWRAAADAASPDASVSELVRWVERTSGTEISAGAGPRATE